MHTSTSLLAEAKTDLLALKSLDARLGMRIRAAVYPFSQLLKTKMAAEQALLGLLNLERAIVEKRSVEVLDCLRSEAMSALDGLIRLTFQDA